MNDNLMELIKSTMDYNRFILSEISNNISLIIENKITNEDVISKYFDTLLSMVFVDEKELIRVYHKLLDYTNTFNKELCKDYEDIFIEYFEDSDKKSLKKSITNFNK